MPFLNKIVAADSVDAGHVFEDNQIATMINLIIVDVLFPLVTYQHTSFKKFMLMLAYLSFVEQVLQVTKSHMRKCCQGSKSYCTHTI